MGRLRLGTGKVERKTTIEKRSIYTISHIRRRIQEGGNQGREWVTRMAEACCISWWRNSITSHGGQDQSVWSLDKAEFWKAERKLRCSVSWCTCTLFNSHRQHLIVFMSETWLAESFYRQYYFNFIKYQNCDFQSSENHFEIRFCAPRDTTQSGVHI